ncbi:putative ABC transport system permease protein [Enemella evansiae]|nr:putative ABC transport system permease protein [Enemella evansiae]
MEGQLGWSLLAAIVLLVGLAMLFSVLSRLGLARELSVAAVRAVLQLAAISLIIVVAIRHLWLAAPLVLLMFAVAVGTSASRCGVRDRWWWVALAMGCGLLPVLVVVFATGAAPLNGASLIPIAGIIGGNTMTGHTLFARRAFAQLRGEQPQYEAGLSIGLERHQVLTELVDPARTEALVPNIDQTRTVGLVTLPGAFIGVLLGGGSPLQAGAAQILVLVGIMAAQTITVTVAARLVAAAKLLPADLRGQLRP